MRNSMTAIATLSASDTPPMEYRSRSDIGAPLRYTSVVRGAKKFRGRWFSERDEDLLPLIYGALTKVGATSRRLG